MYSQEGSRIYQLWPSAQTSPGYNQPERSCWRHSNTQNAIIFDLTWYGLLEELAARCVRCILIPCAWSSIEGNDRKTKDRPIEVSRLAAYICGTLRRHSPERLLRATSGIWKWGADRGCGRRHPK